MATWDTIYRYVVISTDTHAGADIGDYKQYLPKGLHDDFDAWASTYISLFDDLIIARPVGTGTATCPLPTWIPTAWPPRCCCPIQSHHSSRLPPNITISLPRTRDQLKALGRSASAQPLADRLLFAGLGAPPRADPGLPQRHRSGSRRDSLGCGARLLRRGTGSVGLAG